MHWSADIAQFAVLWFSSRSLWINGSTQFRAGANFDLLALGSVGGHCSMDVEYYVLSTNTAVPRGMTVFHQLTNCSKSPY
jgi:hypothetical protein